MSVLRILVDLLPDLRETALCPMNCGPLMPEVANLIIHLNDEENWTREDIADWLEGLDIDLTFPVQE